MKKVVFIMMLLAQVCSIQAQQSKEKKSVFSIGGEAGYALTKIRYSRNDRFGIGGSLQQEFLQKRTGITLNLGYYYPNDYYFIEHQVWLMAGIRYYLTDKFFAAAQLGPGLIKGNDFAGGSFVFSPGVGIKLKPIDISLHYRGTIVSGELFSVAGVRAAITL